MRIESQKNHRKIQKLWVNLRMKFESQKESLKRNIIAMDAHTSRNSRKPFDILQVARQLDAVKKLERDLRSSQSEFSELQRKTSHEVSTVSLARG